MKPEDFKLESTKPDGTPKTYGHIENGKKREQLMKDVGSGKVSKEEFYRLQKKMRGRNGYLKYFFSQAEYLKAITNE